MSFPAAYAARRSRHSYDVCVLTEMQAFNTPLAEAKKACSAATMKPLPAMPEISDEEAARIESAASLSKVGWSLGAWEARRPAAEGGDP